MGGKRFEFVEKWLGRAHLLHWLWELAHGHFLWASVGSAMITAAAALLA